MSELETVVRATVLEIAEITSPDRTSVEAGDDLRDDLGFASLDLAQLAAALEMKLKVDPFRRNVAVTAVRTVGDLCRVYGEAVEAAAEGN